MPRPSAPLPLPARMVPDPLSNGIISPNLSASGATTRLDTAAFVGADEAQGSIGQGIAKFGSALDQIAVKKNEADAITAQYKAAELMEQTKSDITQAVAQEQDQSKWSGIAAEHLGRLSTDLSALPNVPPDVKAGLDHKFNMLGIDVRDGLGQHAIRKSIGDALGSANAVVQRAGMTGDLALGTSTIDGMVSKRFITPEEGDLQREQLGKHVEVTRQNQMKATGEAAIEADPKAAYDHFNSKDFDAPPPVKEFLISKAHARLMQEKQSVSDGLMSKVDSGEIVVPAQIDQERELNPKITEEQAAHAKRALNGINNTARQQWNTENSSKTISGAMSAIRAYDPKSDLDRTQYDAINAYISSNLVTGDKEQARQALTSRASGKAIAEKDPLMQTAVKTITDMQQKGEFGAFTTHPIREIPFTGSDKVEHIYHRQDTVIDRQAQAQSKDLAIQVEASVRDYVKKNPKATNEDVLNEIHRVTPDYISARAVGGLYGIPKQGPVPDDQTQPASSVPTRSDPADIIKGLPQYPGRIPKAGQVDDEPAQKPAAADDSTDTGIHVAAGAVPVESLKASLPAGLKPHAQDFKDAADETGLDPRFLAAVSMFETGNGTSPAFRNKNNAMGISDAHGPTSQASVRDSIFRQARALSNPKGPYRNAKTVEQVAAIYSPPGASNDPNKTNGEWPEAVKKNLRRLKGHS